MSSPAFQQYLTISPFASSSFVTSALLFQRILCLTSQVLISSFLTGWTVSVKRDLKQSYEIPQLTLQRCCPKGSGIPAVERSAGNFFDT